MIEQHAGFVAYEYQEHTVEQRYASYYEDNYGCFGWQVEQQPHGVELQGRETLRLKRDRHIPNRMELTRLQRQFEAIMNDVRRLEHSVQNQATIAGLGCGLAGTVFMGGSTFAITAAAPIVWLCAVLAGGLSAVPVCAEAARPGGSAPGGGQAGRDVRGV